MKPLTAVHNHEIIRAFIEPESNAIRLESQLQNLGIPIYRDSNPQTMLDVAAADILVCAIMHLDDVVICRVLDALRQHNPLAPVLLITTYGRGNAHELLNLPCDDVLFLDELTEPALATALERMRTLTCLRSADELLSKNRFGIDEFVSAVLARACRAPHPLRSVDEIARLAGFHRSTLLRRWRASTPAGSRPHFFIDWLLVVHALLLKRRQSSNWQVVAHRLGVKEQTIRSAAQRTFGATLNELQASQRTSLIQALANILDRRRGDLARG